ncbi:MAG: DUF1838 domain-containing protein, partial [Steroidobacteraceae bacterium]|nr:DUF1838 domain-containing protein [Steroidobacteraceae bacterium]MDW8260428.1 DUF1838 family protein [Gammaproteobacteria bacterium]
MAIRSGRWSLRWFGTCAALAAGCTLMLAQACAASRDRTLDLQDPEELFKAQAKASCSTVQGRPALYWWSGRMWARTPGEPDRHLFNVQGMNIRQCAIKMDRTQGFCYRSVSREVMLYLDPRTNEILRNWRNPWTGEQLTVVHVANDPVNMRPGQWACSRDREGKPIVRESLFVKDELVLEGGAAARLFYKNPLGGEYQDYVGGVYQALEFGTTAVPLTVAQNPRVTEFNDAVISWGRISRWLPWMKMGDREGLVIFHTAG